MSDAVATIDAPAAGTAAPDAAIQSSGISGQVTALPWHESILAKDAAGAETLRPYAEWQDKAPEPLRKFINDNMTAARAKTEGMIKVPAPDAVDEEIQAFYKAIGRPDKAEDYGIKAPEKMPDGVTWDDATATKFAGLAHQIGLTPKQVSALSEFQMASVGENATASRAAMAKVIEQEKVQAKEMFGETLPDTCLIAQQAAGKLGIPAACFDPTSGEYWGNQALGLVARQAREIARLKMEDRGTNAGESTVTGGYAYARAVSEGRHPDYQKYRAGDPEITARVNAGWAQMPKGG